MSEDFIRNGIAGSGIVAARWFAVLASVMLGAAAGASEPAEKAEDVPSLLKQFEKGRRARMLSRKSTGAFLLVKSPDGVGGAFLTTLWKQPVILTCARAWLEFSSPEVCDGDGRVFRIREALMSRERDLVILGYELPPGEQLPAPLKLLEGGSPLSLGSGVAACGRWTMGGKIISIRYDRILRFFISGSNLSHLSASRPNRHTKKIVNACCPLFVSLTSGTTKILKTTGEIRCIQSHLYSSKADYRNKYKSSYNPWSYKRKPSSLYSHKTVE